MTNVALDFSVVQAITRWINDALNNCPPAFIPLAMQAAALHKTVSLSSGLGLIEIWSAFFTVRPSTTTIAELEHLDKLVASLQQSAEAPSKQNFTRYV
jgi:midasin